MKKAMIIFMVAALLLTTAVAASWQAGWMPHDIAWMPMNNDEHMQEEYMMQDEHQEQGGCWT